MAAVPTPVLKYTLVVTYDGKAFKVQDTSSLSQQGDCARVAALVAKAVQECTVRVESIVDTANTVYAFDPK